MPTKMIFFGNVKASTLRDRGHNRTFRESEMEPRANIGHGVLPER